MFNNDYKITRITVLELDINSMSVGKISFYFSVCSHSFTTIQADLMYNQDNSISINEKHWDKSTKTANRLFTKLFSFVFI